MSNLSGWRSLSRAGGGPQLDSGRNRATEAVSVRYSGEEPSMTDSQIHAKAIIAAALIQSRAIDPEAMASLNKDISGHKLAHLRELTDRIYGTLAADSST